MFPSKPIVVAVVLATLLLVGTVAIASAHDGEHDGFDTSTVDRPAFVVELDDSGSAEVTVVMTFDASDDNEREFFNRLHNNDDAKTQFGQAFAARLQTAADKVSTETVREMAVENPRVETRVENDGETLVVEVSATWTNLAAVNGDTMKLQEPFNDMGLDREFIVVPPESYEVSSSSPDPDKTDHALVWSSPDFTSFTVSFEHQSESIGTPGFGIVAVFMSAPLSMWLLHRRRTS